MKNSMFRAAKGGGLRVSLIGVFFLLSLGACSWESQDEFYPPPELCDTLEVSFSEDVQPMLSQHCWACHSDANAPSFGNGMALESHADVAQRIPLIVSVINHEDGVPQMPRGSAKLDTCSIATFEAWMNQGSMDN